MAGEHKLLTQSGFLRYALPAACILGLLMFSVRADMNCPAISVSVLSCSVRQV